MSLEEAIARLTRLEEALYGQFDDRIRELESARHRIYYAVQPAPPVNPPIDMSISNSAPAK